MNPISNALDSLFARVYEPLMAKTEKEGLADLRRQLLGDLSGDVLEVGAGTGLNVEVYPETVTSLTFTEPSAPMAARLRQRVEQARPSATVVDASAEQLPFDDASFDAVVCTLVLCSVTSPTAAAREMRRVLRPDGRLVVIEHVAAPDGWAATAQRALTPVQKVAGRNCHLTRNTRATLDAAGFDTSTVVDFHLPGGGAALFPAIQGVATPA